MDVKKKKSEPKVSSTAYVLMGNESHNKYQLLNRTTLHLLISKALYANATERISGVQSLRGRGSNLSVAGRVVDRHRHRIRAVRKGAVATLP